MQHGKGPAPADRRRSSAPPRLEASPADTALLELLGGQIAMELE